MCVCEVRVRVRVRVCVSHCGRSNSYAGCRWLRPSWQLIPGTEWRATTSGWHTCNTHYYNLSCHDHTSVEFTVNIRGAMARFFVQLSSVLSYEPSITRLIHSDTFSPVIVQAQWVTRTKAKLFLNPNNNNGNGKWKWMLCICGPLTESPNLFWSHIILKQIEICLGNFFVWQHFLIVM